MRGLSKRHTQALSSDHGRRGRGWNVRIGSLPLRDDRCLHVGRVGEGRRKGASWTGSRPKCGRAGRISLRKLRYRIGSAVTCARPRTSCSRSSTTRRPTSSSTPKAGTATFRAEAEAWLAHHLGADSSISTYQSVLRTHVYPAIGDRQIRVIRREDIKAVIAAMNRKGLSASRIGCAHLVISAVFNEAVRNQKLPESPCTDIPVPGVVYAADFVLPADEELEALAAGLPADWAATVWLMYGCGLRI